MAIINLPSTYDPSRILIADDEPEHLEWLVDYLKTKGYEATLKTSIKDAIGGSGKAQIQSLYN